MTVHDNILVKPAEGLIEIAYCIQIRTLVFTVRQKVPRSREIDKFENNARHYIAYSNDKPAGAARWRLSQEASSVAKLERMAVLDDYRSQGIGQKLLKKMIQDISDIASIDTIILGAQDHAIDFYKSLGFEVFGESYQDGGGIPHHDMKYIIEQKEEVNHDRAI